MGNARDRVRKALVTPIRQRSPGFFFLWSCAWLLVLVALPVLYDRDIGKIQHKIEDPIAGIVPIGVPLAGALGAVTIGLYGIFRHNDPAEWKPKYAYWHLARPLMGTVLGVFGFMIFVAVIQASGADVNLTGTTTAPTEQPAPDDGTGDADDPDDREGLIVYYLVAFLVGFREENFRELIKRASDLLFKASGDDTTGPAGAAVPAIGGAGPPVAIGAAGDVEGEDLAAAGVSYEPYLDGDEAAPGGADDCAGEDPR